LVKAGTDGKSIVVSNGRVVDEGLQTEVDNLFVCDASVFPTSPGMPPILTIVALAKRLEALSLIGRRVAFLYIIPTFQNPSGVTLAAERREALVELATERGLLLVEDGVEFVAASVQANPSSSWAEIIQTGASSAPPGDIEFGASGGSHPLSVTSEFNPVPAELTITSDAADPIVVAVNSGEVTVNGQPTGVRGTTRFSGAAVVTR